MKAPGDLTLSEFADRIGEIMPQVMRQFLKKDTEDFYKTKVTLPQFVVMDIVHKRAEISMSELARQINVTTAAMTGIVDRLVKDACMKRAHDQKDRRIIKVTLTDKGSSIVRRMLGHRRKMVMKMFGLVSGKDRADYLRILTKVRDGLKR